MTACLRRADPTRRAPAAPVGLLVILLSATGCGGPIVAAEPDTVPRAELMATFTPLPPRPATLTPLPPPTPIPPYATATPDQFQAAGLPVRLRIPAIRVDAAVEHTGLLPSGVMDVPKIPENVAWFNLGPLPGQPGNAVISGHLDSASHRAVFYELRLLIPGDEIVVTYENGDEYIFVVERKERYYFDEAPVEIILGDGYTRRLNLYTCDGAWDQGSHNYQQRLVVYTRLKQH